MRLCVYINQTNALPRQLRQRQAALIRLPEVAAIERPPGGLVDQEAHFCGAINRSRMTRFASVTDQSDHSSDPKADLARYPPNANAP